MFVTRRSSQLLTRSCNQLAKRPASGYYFIVVSLLINLLPMTSLLPILSRFLYTFLVICIFGSEGLGGLRGYTNGQFAFLGQGCYIS